MWSKKNRRLITMMPALVLASPRKAEIFQSILKNLNRFMDLDPDLLFMKDMEPSAPYPVLSARVNHLRRVSMQPSAQIIKAPQPIPQHVLDRMESEWRQVREPAPQPVAAR
ncbi:hypothetical protein P7F60_00565 [Rhizobium sp. YJ-22]|uniref:hypothetical protein n=1 Tax=Rhizobium sp. YJ-22 TaxID=3037556 RepID=UPI0024122771|nr:hypothetical protein [Rhizobium sp. YJ-22]MDG3574862.1 hypothetical protein [Rhizobium sp. YJ-22]